jgi:hypothetical protein
MRSTVPTTSSVSTTIQIVPATRYWVRTPTPSSTRRVFCNDHRSSSLGFPLAKGLVGGFDRYPGSPTVEASVSTCYPSPSHVVVMTAFLAIVTLHWSRVLPLEVETSAYTRYPSPFHVVLMTTCLAPDTPGPDVAPSRDFGIKRGNREDTNEVKPALGFLSSAAIPT